MRLLPYASMLIRRAAGTIGLVLLSSPGTAAQVPAKTPGHDSVTIAASHRYGGGTMRRLFLGKTYRDLWATDIRVLQLDLGTFAGGLKATKTGHGNQTRSLRFNGADGVEYVFRLVDKSNISVPKSFNGSAVAAVAWDQISAHHPGGILAAPPILEAAHVLHVTPILAVMPDAAELGEFRQEFGGKLGTIEEYPGKPDDVPGFAGASAVIDSDELRALLDHGAGNRVDARALLTARLVDMLLNDWDRHPGNWKWARFKASADALWEPVPRDRDKVFIQYGGIVVRGHFKPSVIAFQSRYPALTALTNNSLDLDRRLLVGLEKPVWDSVAQELTREITDQVIDSAVHAMPPEYLPMRPDITAKLRMRRDSIPAQANRFYAFLAKVPDIDATDSADRALVTRFPDGSVEVRLTDPNDRAYFRRRFQPGETKEVRIYLHGGDDSAVISGTAAKSIPVRLIGGNGNNRLVDSSLVGGHRHPTHLYDVGSVTGVPYGPDTLWNRRPWIHDDGLTIKPGRDRGGKMAPAVGLSANGDLGLVILLGMNRYSYGFRAVPYASRFGVTGEYATGASAFRVTGSMDRRTEGSPLHLVARARMSEFEVVNYHGLGNSTDEGTGDFFKVEQRQWLLQPALAFALSSRSDISLGPVIQYSTTDVAPGSFLATARPYGSGNFGQAGLRLGVYIDKRDQPKYPQSGILVDASGTWYPGVWDVRTSFGAVAASGAGYVTLPLPHHPVFVLRASGRKVYGDFPFQESAFLGGRGSVRSLDLQRYAGDAVVSGTTELQVPLLKFPLLVPLDIGMYGFAETGRVYVHGASPGGWHSDAGVGLWLGVLSPSTALNFELGGRPGQSVVRVRTGLSF